VVPKPLDVICSDYMFVIIAGGLYAASGRKVFLIDTESFSLLRQFAVNTEVTVPFKVNK
jgi:hypothetical protein